MLLVQYTKNLRQAYFVHMVHVEIIMKISSVGIVRLHVIYRVGRKECEEIIEAQVYA